MMLQQLDPTLQGSDAAHKEGLEQTLLDRLMKMVKGGSQPWTVSHVFGTYKFVVFHLFGA